MEFFKTVINLRPLNYTNYTNDDSDKNEDVPDSNLTLFNYVESKMKNLITNKFDGKFVFENTNNKVNEIYYFFLVEIGRLLKPKGYTEKVEMNINTEEVNDLFEKTNTADTSNQAKEEQISSINTTKEVAELLINTNEENNEAQNEIVNVISASPRDGNSTKNNCILAPEIDSWKDIYSKIEKKYKLFNTRLLQSDKPETWGYGASDFKVQVIPSNQIFYSQEKEQKESNEELGCEKSAHKEVNTQDFFDVRKIIIFIYFLNLEFKQFSRMDYGFWHK